MIDLPDYQFENPCPPNLRQVTLVLDTVDKCYWYWTLVLTCAGLDTVHRWYWPI